MQSSGILGAFSAICAFGLMFIAVGALMAVGLDLAIGLWRMVRRP